MEEMFTARCRERAQSFHVLLGCATFPSLYVFPNPETLRAPSSHPQLNRLSLVTELSLQPLPTSWRSRGGTDPPTTGLVPLATRPHPGGIPKVT